MFTRADRFEVSLLALALMAWSLVAAPLLHSVTHEHGTKHSHGAQHQHPAQPQQHGDGSFEHHAVLLASAAPVVAGPHVALADDVVAPGTHAAATLVARRTSAQPQGP